MSISLRWIENQLQHLKEMFLLEGLILLNLKLLSLEVERNLKLCPASPLIVGILLPLDVIMTLLIEQ